MNNHYNWSPIIIYNIFIILVSFMASLHSNRTASMTDIATREQSVLLMGLTKLFLVEIWKTLGHWTRKVSELKGGLLGHPSKTIKDGVHESDGDDDIWIKRFQTGRILVNDIETVLVYFGEECGCFMPLSKKFCPSLNWKAFD